MVYQAVTQRMSLDDTPKGLPLSIFSTTSTISPWNVQLSQMQRLLMSVAFNDLASFIWDVNRPVKPCLEIKQSGHGRNDRRIV
jgi:hypothetical protein